MTPRDDKVEKEDRRERYERRKGQPAQGSESSPPRKRREPYDRNQFRDTSWDDDLEDDWLED